MQVESWKFQDEYFGELLPYVKDQKITDINCSGSDVWVEHLDKGCYKTSLSLGKEFLIQFSVQISNLVSEQINKYTPVLEAETDTLRISIIYPSVTNTGYAVSIRKTPPVMRLHDEKMIREGYCNQETLEFLKNCVRRGWNIMFCGTPGAGKTELLKYLTQYIPKSAKVMTIEDNLEIHYKDINPQAHCVELKVDEILFSYTKAIKTALRQDPKWVLLSEARSQEVKYLMECFSTGLHGLTTLHTDDVRKIPDRIVNMMKEDYSDRVINDVYSFVNVGVLLSKVAREDQRVLRRIEQVCVFSRHQGQNVIHMLVKNGKPTEEFAGWIRHEAADKEGGQHE